MEIPTNLTFWNNIDACLDFQKGYSIKCLQANFCPQIPAYFVSWGIGLVITYVIFSWLRWALWRPWAIWKDYGTLDMEWGIFYAWVPFDFTKDSTRLYWERMLNNIIGKLLVGFCVILVYYYI